MSRAVLYRRSEEQKQKFSNYGILAVVFYLATLLVGVAIYSSSNLPIYLSMNAAITSGGGVALFTQSLLVLLSFFTLTAASILAFLSRATTTRGEFTSSSKLLYSALALLGVTTVFAVSALLPPASEYINPLYFIYIVLLVVGIAVMLYAIALLRGVVAYYTPRRK